MSETTLSRPRLATGVRLRWDAVRDSNVLLYPEGALTLNQTAADVLALCDGQRTIDQIVEELSARHEGADVRADVVTLIDAIASRGLIVDADG
jgi:pyrroloquinoline quinone biosynthesis protein D